MIATLESTTYHLQSSAGTHNCSLKKWPACIVNYLFIYVYLRNLCPSIIEIFLSLGLVYTPSDHDV